MYNNEQVLEGF